MAVTRREGRFHNIAFQCRYGRRLGMAAFFSVNVQCPAQGFFVLRRRRGINFRLFSGRRRVAIEDPALRDLVQISSDVPAFAEMYLLSKTKCATICELLARGMTELVYEGHKLRAVWRGFAPLKDDNWITETVRKIVLLADGVPVVPPSEQISGSRAARRFAKHAPILATIAAGSTAVMAESFAAAFPVVEEGIFYRLSFHTSIAVGLLTVVIWRAFFKPRKRRLLRMAVTLCACIALGYFTTMSALFAANGFFASPGGDLQQFQVARKWVAAGVMGKIYRVRVASNEFSLGAATVRVSREEFDSLQPGASTMHIEMRSGRLGLPVVGAVSSDGAFIKAILPAGGISR